MNIALPGAPPADPSSLPDPTTQRVVFDGAEGDFVTLSVRGALLQLVTFGFYRFWLTTDVRRHLWTHTSAAGDHLEYTGRGRELLVGFLFALAILVPIYLAYFLIGVEVERFQAFGSVPLGIFMLFFGQFAIYRARRYRLTRTVWRGVRFWMQGSGWAYAARAFGWQILVVLSLGLAWPWRAAALERYKLRNTFYGDLAGSFDARASAFFRTGVWLWLAALAPVLILISAGAIYWATDETRPVLAGTIAAIGGVLFLPVPFLWPYFRAMEWRWWATGVRFGSLSVECDLRGGQLLKLYFKFFIIASLVSGAAAGAVFAIGAAVVEQLTKGGSGSMLESMSSAFESNQVLLVAGTTLGYLIVGLSVGVVQRYFLQREMWCIVARSLTIRHIDAAENVVARGEAANAIGEGLADSLDVAGF